ncbi:uncharacterized protein LOC105440163 isoform X2 [Strongylocentrotus purpuratus]|uniref:ZU5 domain-containing protein n=1 Tax=Strongylocentrotus purpuratus TaxID=7668 RepID=A0A7M7T348_STRPU|nr:uncharacterized protein LOC105440163 isoform X2 [Strongylocentrotus purpuratus]
MESLPHVTDEVNFKPNKMECCKRVGVEGDKLQLDTFGIELEIPPGAIDSEAPRDIYLRVLTDTPNLGISKEEMSVCFGVQCLAPHDLVLKLPVTYTIPHCAVITRYSSVEAVLYTGEGEYSPDAEVKEPIPLTQSGIPNCNIERDLLRLQMNHFCWAFIRFKLNVFFGGKRMCCLPFAQQQLPEERTPVILRAYLYDGVKGSKEIASQEEEIGFAHIHPEAEVLIKVAEVDVKMTCFIKDDPIGNHAAHTVTYDELRIGRRWTKSFNLDLSSQLDKRIVVTLKVGQTGQSLVELLCMFNFAMNSSGKLDDFEKKLTTVARNVATRVDIDNLRKALRLQPGDVQHYVNDNPNSSYMVTLSMIQDWRKKQTKATECGALKDVLEKAGQIHLANELFGT